MSLYNKVYRPALYSIKDIDNYIYEMLVDRRDNPQPNKKPRVADYKKEEAAELLGKGFSVREVASKTGIHRATVGRILKRMRQG